MRSVNAVASFPAALGRAVWSETLKVNRTLALGSAVIAPIVVAMLQFVIYVSRDGMLTKGANPFVLMSHALSFFCVLMLPLLTTLVSALLFGLEHQNGGFRNLYTRPLPREAFHAAKILVLTGLLALSFAVLVVSILLGGAAILVLRPEVSGAPEIGLLLTRALACLVASLPMMVLAAWVAGRFPSFTVASATGIAATVIGFIAANTEWWIYVYPYMLPTASLRLIGGFGSPGTAPPPVDPAAFLATVTAVGLVLAVLSTRDVARLPR